MSFDDMHRGIAPAERPRQRVDEYAARVIVVVGQPLHRVSDLGVSAEGLAARTALAAAAHGRSVQLVGKAGDDAEGDAMVLALAHGGVGHVALLREAGRSTPRVIEPIGDEDAAPEHGAGDRNGAEAAAETPSAWATLEAADVDLALRYLAEFAVLVLADPADPETVRVVADAAGWVGARLVVVVRPGAAVPDGLPPDVIVFEAPETDPDGAFASLVGAFAAALDDGDDPAEAFRSSIETDGWTTSTDL